jgi:type IV pilus assembly protein PilW
MMKTCSLMDVRTGSLRDLAQGMSLVELLLAVTLSSVLTLALVQLASAARGSFRLQESLAELQENSRFFADLLAVHVSDSGFHPQPWLYEATPVGLMPASRDAISPNSDRVVIRSWSNRNCFGSVNPQHDSSGQAVFHLRESVVELSNGSLVLSCRYGPADDAMTTQVNRQGVIPQVEAFQVLYASDADGDGEIDQWVRAEEWDDLARILAVRLGILSSSRESVIRPEARDWQILDFTYKAPADGRLRRVASYTLPLHGVRP